MCRIFASRYSPHSLPFELFQAARGPGSNPETSRYAKAIPQRYRDSHRPLNQARAAAMLTHRRHRPRLKAAIPLSDLVFFQAEFGRPQ